MPRNETEGLWTVDELAAHLKLRPKTIRNRVSLKTIPYLKVGGSLRFRPSEIRRWINQETASAKGSE